MTPDDSWLLPTGRAHWHCGFLEIVLKALEGARANPCFGTDSLTHESPWGFRCSLLYLDDREERNITFSKIFVFEKVAEFLNNEP